MYVCVGMCLCVCVCVGGGGMCVCYTCMHANVYVCVWHIPDESYLLNFALVLCAGAT